MPNTEINLAWQTLGTHEHQEWKLEVASSKKMDLADGLRMIWRRIRRKIRGMINKKERKGEATSRADDL